MATGKKSFVLYTDLHETVKQLPDNKAGILFKTILAYVNDENPDVKDLLIKIAFEPVKLQLKRDLKKWEKEHNQRILAGQASAEARRLAKEQSEREATESNDRSTTVDEIKQASTVTGIVTVTENESVKTGYREIFSFFSNSKFSELWEEFLKLKRRKKASTADVQLSSQLNKLVEISENKIEIALKIIEKSVNSGWPDFYPLKDGPKQFSPHINGINIDEQFK